MRKLLLFLLFSPMILRAQIGIKFQHGLSWKQIVEKAKSENKYIFVDAFATWCGPCKYMSANVFTQSQIGEQFNNNFINVKAQMDSTQKDNEDVKNWYEDAHMLGVDYKVRAYPTYLIFNSEGKIVHRFVGSMSAEEFSQKAKQAMDPANQYYSLLDRYKSGAKDPAFLLNFANATYEANDDENMKMASKDYLATQNDLLSKENVDFIFKFTTTSKDAGFNAILKNEAKINKAKGDQSATQLLVEIIKHEELGIFFAKKTTVEPDWKFLNASISKKYPAHADEVVSSGKVTYYLQKKDWTHFQFAVQNYMKKYGAQATPAQLNQYAWAVFENCTDISCLKDALEWSKRSIKPVEDPAFMDTYANLLYKTGSKDEAIAVEEKCLSMVGDEEKQGYQETTEKMKKGEKTWKQ